MGTSILLSKINLNKIARKVYVLLIILSLSSINVIAAPQVNLNQARNGSCTSPISPVPWVNGNINPQHAHYTEGNSIPYQVIMSNMTVGVAVDLTLEFDTRGSSKNALDFLTGYNNIEPHEIWSHTAEIINPVIDYPQFTLTNDAHITILPPGNMPTRTYFNEFMASHTVLNYMSIWGANPRVQNPFEYITEQPLTSVKASTKFTIHFTPTATTVILAWGGHLASAFNWGIGNSCGGINGSDYHTRLISWSLGNLGNQDRSCQNSVVLLPFDCNFTVSPTTCPNSTLISTINFYQPLSTYNWSIVENNTGATPLSGTGKTFILDSGPETNTFIVQLLVSVNYSGTTISQTCTQIVSVKQPLSTETHTNVSCAGNATGSIDLSVTGGTAPYYYTWTGTLGGIVPQGQEHNQDLTGLVAGTYNVLISDIISCISSRDVIITPPSSCTPIWSGLVDTNWFNPGNWIGNVVPAATDNVIIPADCPNYPDIILGPVIICNDLTIDAGGSVNIGSGGALTVNGDLVNSGSLVIESGGSIITTCNITGTATIERNISNDLAWHFLSSPVENQEICNGIFAPTISTFPGNNTTWDFYKWLPNCPTPPLPPEHWRNLRTSSETINYLDFGTPPSFIVTKGYLVAYGDDWPITKSFVGNMNTCDQVCSFLDIISNCSWELAGNPFPSSLAWSQVTGKTNLDNDYYYVWNENKAGGSGYEYWKDSNHQSSIAIDGNIPPMQGFFVKVNLNGGKTLGLPNSARVHDVGADMWLKDSPVNKLTITLSDGTYYDKAFVMFENNSDVGKDPNDAEKLFSLNTGIPQVYTIIDNDMKTALNSMSYVTNGTTIPVGFVATAEEDYNITFTGIESFTSLSGLSLEDLKLNYTQNLLQNPVYHFTTNGTENASRFLLHFAGPIGVGEKRNNTVNIYANGKNVFITCAAGFRNAQVSVSNLLGQEILKQKLSNQQMNQVEVNAIKGYYVVKVQDEFSVKTCKVYIN